MSATHLPEPHNPAVKGRNDGDQLSERAGRLDLTSRLEDFSGLTNNVRFADLDPKEHVNNAV